MLFTMRLFLAGLIAFAPSQNGNMVNVLLISAPAHKEVGKCESHKHSPVLVVRADQVALAECPGKSLSFEGLLNSLYVEQRLLMAEQKQETVHSVSDVKLCYFPLEGTELRIHGLLEGEPLLFAKGKKGGGFFSGPSKSPKAKEESSDFSWLAKMSDILSEGGELKSELLENVSADIVASRYAAGQGTFKICRLVQYPLSEKSDEQRKVPIFDFVGFNYNNLDVNSYSSYSQVLADVAVLESKMKDSHLVIALLDAGNLQIRQVIPIAVKSGDSAEVLVLNMPSSGPPDGDCANVGSDFARFFELAKYKGNMFLPHRTPRYEDPSVQPDCPREALDSYLKLYRIQAILEGNDEGRDRLLDLFNSEIAQGKEPEEALRSVQKSLESRSVCPMVTF